MASGSLRWGTYIEVIDAAGNVVVPDGTEGELVITLLGNYAMPLIRYRIGDAGALAPQGAGHHPQASQSLQSVKGRTVDAFLSRRWHHHRRRILHAPVVLQGLGPSIPGCPEGLQAHCGANCFQQAPSDAESEVSEGIRALMGARCRVEFEYCGEIETSASGKYRYTLSELP